MKEQYSVILLSRSGDFLLRDSDELERTENGVEAEQPYIMTEDEEAQRIQADRIFIPYNTMENIQYGDFEQETVE